MFNILTETTVHENVSVLIPLLSSQKVMTKSKHFDLQWTVTKHFCCWLCTSFKMIEKRSTFYKKRNSKNHFEKFFWCQRNIFLLHFVSEKVKKKCESFRNVLFLKFSFAILVICKNSSVRLSLYTYIKKTFPQCDNFEPQVSVANQCKLLQNMTSFLKSLPWQL